jgi:hypothetical protein
VVDNNIPPLAPITATQGTAAHDAVAGGATSRPHPASGDLPFAVGQHLFARVVQVMDERTAVLELAGQRVLASTPEPVSTGQLLNVAVRGVGPVVDLALVESAAAVSDEHYALAAVLEARHATAPAAPPSLEQVRALLEAVARLPIPTMHQSARAELLERAAAALLPPSLQADGDTLLQGLRRAIAGSGAFFEGRLAAMVTHGATTPDARVLQDDVKAVLAELAALTTSAAPLEETRARLVADVLARQVDVAYHKLRDGELRLDVPVLVYGALADVQLRVRDERGASQDDDAAAGRQVDLELELPDIGRVRTSMAWTPGHLATRFAVAGAEPAQTLRAGLETLSTRLQSLGFRHVSLRVDVDPAALAARPDDPEPPLPGGSILHVRA